MRNIGLALAGVVLWQAAGTAQQAPPQAQPAPGAPIAPAVALDPATNRLDNLLIGWEREMRKVQTLSAQLTRMEDNKTFGYKDVFQGTARYMKHASTDRTTNLALLEMRKQNKPDVMEKFVCNGTTLYQWLPQQKEIRAHQLPVPRAGQVAEDNFLSFLFGMKAEECKRRYDLTLVKEDQYYFYVKILPRFDADKADFQQARLALNKDTFLPRQLWFEQPNGDTVTWDIPKIDNGAPLDPREFQTPVAPAGWKLVTSPRVTDDAPPRIYRNQGGR